MKKPQGDVRIRNNAHRVVCASINDVLHTTFEMIYEEDII